MPNPNISKSPTRFREPYRSIRRHESVCLLKCHICAHWANELETNAAKRHRLLAKLVSFFGISHCYLCFGSSTPNAYLSLSHRGFTQKEGSMDNTDNLEVGEACLSPFFTRIPACF